MLLIDMVYHIKLQSLPHRVAKSFTQSCKVYHIELHPLLRNVYESRIFRLFKKCYIFKYSLRIFKKNPFRFHSKGFLICNFRLLRRKKYTSEEDGNARKDNLLLLG